VYTARTISIGRAAGYGVIGSGGRSDRDDVDGVDAGVAAAGGGVAFEDDEPLHAVSAPMSDTPARIASLDMGQS
jgi:hypothetical protein